MLLFEHLVVMILVVINFDDTMHALYMCGDSTLLGFSFRCGYF